MRKSVAIALVDQAVLSLFNLGLNLAMIRFAAPQEFGRFILAAAAIRATRLTLAWGDKKVQDLTFTEIVVK